MLAYLSWSTSTGVSLALPNAARQTLRFARVRDSDVCRPKVAARNGGYGASNSNLFRGGLPHERYRPLNLAAVSPGVEEGGYRTFNLRHQLPPALLRLAAEERYPPIAYQYRQWKSAGLRMEAPQLCSLPKTAWAPTPLAMRGPVSPLRNFWDVADHIAAELALGLRARRRGSCSQRFRSALPLWHVERGRRLDPGRPRVIPFARRSHGYPVFLPAFPSAGGCVAFALPVHDDVMTLSPVRCVCQ